LRAPRTCAEVRFRLLARDTLGGSGDADLSLDVVPVKTQRRAPRGVELPALPAPVIGEKRKAALVDPLEQHDSNGRLALATHGRERHRIRFPHAGTLSLVKPCAELGKWITRDVALIERRVRVLASQGGEVGHEGNVNSRAPDARAGETVLPCETARVDIGEGGIYP